ncbi:MAG: hypothetical protein KTR26_14170 [Flammeovirgaceae bacterium]|nr:hypothetical protein [Flammeovirgaceae bacterium]
MLILQFNRLLLLFTLTYYLGLVSLLAQSNNEKPVISELIMKIGEKRYALGNNLISYNGDKYLAFEYTEGDEVVEVKMYLYAVNNVKSLELVKSNDYAVVDSLLNFNDQYYAFKIKFNNLSQSDYLNFTFKVFNEDGDEYYQRINLFPFTQTAVTFIPQGEELYVGEVKTFELLTNNIQNINTKAILTEGEEINYWLSQRGGKLMLHVIPSEPGKKTLNLKIRVLKPFLNEDGEPTYELPVITRKFTIKESRLTFLDLDNNDIILDENTQLTGIEIQIENNPKLKLGKTYRIEAQEERGGALVAEIFTRSSLSNNRVLCWLRVYAYHRIGDGYLYIKDGDEAQFITNFRIGHKTKITKVSILRSGEEWTDNLSIYPGELIDVRVEGVALDKANLRFAGLYKLLTDSAQSNDHRQVFTLSIPITISKRRIYLTDHGEQTPFSLVVKEFQKPMPLDFVKINYGEGARPITEFDGPVLYNKNIQDVIISFDASLLDRAEKLHGKQYLSIDIQVTGNRRELIDLKTINDVVICPAETSYRFPFYAKNDCNRENITLNNYIRRKTHELYEWSKIELTVRHRKDKYSDQGYIQKFELILARRSSFDIDISFPAGLLIQKAGEEDIGSFSGISIAAIAQFKFYKPKSIAQLRPYRIGAGFLAINSFNFNDDADRDLALVVLGSVYPIKREDSKLNFPLHVGAGFLMGDQKWFYLVGPGIKIRF